MRWMKIAITFGILLIVIPLACNADDNWKTYSDSKFEIDYPYSWIIREQTSDSDGYYYSFKDNSRKMGGLGVYFITKKSLFGSSNAELTDKRYQDVVKHATTSTGQLLGEVSNSGISGRSYIATQNVGGKPAEWRVNIYPYGDYVCIVFGFYRPDDPAQEKLVSSAIDSFNFLKTPMISTTVPSPSATPLSTSITKTSNAIPRTTKAAGELLLPIIALIFFVSYKYRNSRV